MTAHNIKLTDLLDGPIASPPSLYLKLQKAIEDPETTYEVLAEIIHSDPGFTARLLRIANSSFYGFQSKIESVHHAINILGSQDLTGLALATLVIEKFRGVSKDLIQMDSFWKHSIACGLGARCLAEFKKIISSDRYYLCGLLHDIGSLVVYKELSLEAETILNGAEQSKKNLFVVEKEVLGFDHAEVGGALLKKWLLPDVFVEAVRFHNDPLKAEKYPLGVSIIHLADNMSYEMELGYSGEPQIPVLGKTVLSDLGLSKDDLTGVKEKMLEHFDETVDLFLK